MSAELKTLGSGHRTQLPTRDRTGICRSRPLRASTVLARSTALGDLHESGARVARRAIDPEVASEEDVEVPSIFQVLPEDGGSATN